MTSILDTIAPKSDQMNADDLIGGARTIKITRVDIVGGEQPVNVYFEGDNGKPFRPCKGMRRVIVQAWGDDHENFAGRLLTLYRDPTVKWAGAEVGGIRISHMSHIDRQIQTALTISKGKRDPFVVQPINASDHQAPALSEDDSKRLLADAEAAARGGVAQMTRFWQDPKVKPYRSVIRPHLDRLQVLATEADAATADDDPMAIDTRPSDAEMKAAEEAAMAARSTDSDEGVDPGKAPVGLQ